MGNRHASNSGAHARGPRQHVVERRGRCLSCDADVSGLPADDIDDCGYKLQVLQVCPRCDARLVWQYYVTACDVLDVANPYAGEPRQYDAVNRQRCPSCGADVSGVPMNGLDDLDDSLQAFQTCPHCGVTLCWHYRIARCDVADASQGIVATRPLSLQ